MRRKRDLDKTNLENDGFLALHNGGDYRFSSTRDEVAVTSPPDVRAKIGAGTCGLDNLWAAVVRVSSEGAAGGHGQRGSVHDDRA